MHLLHTERADPRKNARHAENGMTQTYSTTIISSAVTAVEQDMQNKD